MNNVGLHIIGDAFDPARLVGPQGQKPHIVKLLDPSVEFKRRVRAEVGPDFLIVIRFWEPEQRLGAPDTDARWWYSNHVAQMLQMRDPYVAFESYNEVGDGQARQYAQFEATRLGLMHAAGFRSVVGNFSVGTPDLGTWYTYRPMLDAMKEGDFLGLHEYWPHADGIDNRWWCGRWDLVPEIRMRPIIVTECGRDYVGGQGAQGWVGHVSAEQYVAEIEKYAQVLNGKLAVVFTGGDTSHGWDKFSVNDIWERITSMYSPSQPEEPPPIQPPQNDNQPVPDIFYLLLGPRASECHTSGTSQDHLDRGTHVAYDVAGMKRWPVYAVADGYVDFVAYESATHPRGRGHTLGVVHPSVRVGPLDVLETSPCHLAEQPLVKPGQSVKKGQLLGYTGWSGKVIPPNEYGEHVHLNCYSVRNNAAASPWAYIRPESLRVEIL